MHECEALDQTKDLIEKLRNSGNGEAYDLRLKLRATLRRMIRNVVVLVVEVNRDRVALADVELLNGKRRQVVIRRGNAVALPDCLSERDVREWGNWPEKFRKARWRAANRWWRKKLRELD